MDIYMKKFYSENYNNQQLERIKKLNKILTDAYHELFIERKKIIYKNKKEKTKLNKDEIEKIFSKFEDMYYLTSFITEEKIIEIILKCDGDEDKIQEEIEKIL